MSADRATRARDNATCLLRHAVERVTNALDNLGRAVAATARDAIVLEFPSEEWTRARCEPASATCGTGSDLA